MTSWSAALRTRRRGCSAASVLAVVVVLALALGGCGDDDSAAPGEAAEHGPGMAHVHGLGVDPADGALLAGTHFGTFRIGEDGHPEQIGPTQDFMGFTVVGERHYLASGHPGAGQDAPANLGLIESTDGGRTWETVALEGEADFHVLEARHGRVYGHTGGTLLVSSDKRSWERRAVIPLADFAVSASDPDTLLATTQQGLVRSGDGGRTFERLPGAPPLVLISWIDQGRLVGVGPSGDVHTSGDAGGTWQARGSVQGLPVALTATDSAVFVATEDGRIVESTDDGATFTTRYDGP